MLTHMRIMHQTTKKKNMNTKTVERGDKLGLPSMVGYN